jgi:cytoskeletal protein RodZ
MTDTIGQRLQQERAARRLTLEQAAQATRIRIPYLEAIERDDFTVMPSPVQGRGFLRLYAQYLGLDVDLALEEMRAAAVRKPTETEIISLDGQESPKMDETDQPPAQARAQIGTRLMERFKALRVQTAAGAAEPEAGTPPESDSPGPEAGTTSEAAAQLEVPAEPEMEAQPVPAVSMSWLAQARERLSSRRESAPEIQEDQPEGSPPPESYHAIFIGIGSELRARRELLSLTLDEIEQHTRVRRRYLQALESGEVDALPSPVQTRGMLHNYAAFLDVDAEKLLLRYAEGLQARHRERQPLQTPSSRGRRTLGRFLLLRRFIAGDMFFGIGMIIILVVFVVWATGRVLTASSQPEAEAQAPSISDVLLATSASDEGVDLPTPTLVLDGVAAPQQTATALPDVQVPTLPPFSFVQVTLNVLERTWVRVLVDGEVKFEGRVTPGTAYTFDGQNQVEVLAGSGAALQVVYNQKDQGRLGSFGEVVNRIYTRDAIVTPTATVSPTPTVTLPPTSTPVPSPTPAPTRAVQ